MTCNGCRSKVEKTLNAIDGVEAKVSLNPSIATITMEKHIPTTQLQEALSAVGKYTIKVTNGNTPQQITTNNDTTKSCCSWVKNGLIGRLMISVPTCSLIGKSPFCNQDKRVLLGGAKELGSEQRLVHLCH